MSTHKDLTIHRGNRLLITCQFAPVEDITGHTFSFSLRKEGESETSTYDSTSGFSITNGAGGTFTLTLASTVTDDWTEGVYAYQLRDETSGSEEVVSHGRLTVLPCFSL